MNKNLELLNLEVFFLPKERTNPNFPEYLDKILAEYLEVIFEFEGTIGNSLRENRGNIERLCLTLQDSIRVYYDGKPTEASNIFLDGMGSIEPILWKQKREFSLATPDIHFYRGRTSDGSKPYSRGDLLHIPFESRHRISTNRYSIPGYPCLYLADSIYTCWKECGEPDFNTFQVSRFDAHKYRFLEISFTHQFISNFYTGTLKDQTADGLADPFVIYFLTAWPLIASCSIRKMKFPENERVNFIAEYIIPQMLMEWVKQSQNLDGIKYFSTHGDSNAIEWGEMKNYAIPVKKIQPSGYCPQLIYDMPLSEPLFHSHLVRTSGDYESRKYSDGAGDKDSAGHYRTFSKITLFKGEDGAKQWYIDTKYGKLEVELSKLAVEKFTP